MTAVNPFAAYGPDALIAPAMHGFDAYAQKDDAAELTVVTRAIYTGSGGDIKVTLAGGDTVTLTDVPAGSLLPISIRQLWDTGTAATDVIGLY